MKTTHDLETAFGSRLVTLANGQPGLRCSLAVEAKAVEGQEATMDFVATTERVDHYDEVIQLAGWDLKDYRRNPVVVDCHDYSSITRILGSSTDLQIKDGRMINRVKFATENPLGNLAWKLASAGHLRAESVGFMPENWEDGIRGTDQPSRTFTKQSLLEISLVVVPANADAVRGVLGSAIKSGAVTKPDLTAVLEALKSLCSPKAESRPDARDAGPRLDVSHLQLARGLSEVLGRA